MGLSKLLVSLRVLLLKEKKKNKCSVRNMEERIINLDSSHKQLYKLKYLEHVADPFVLSQQLKVPLGKLMLLSEELDAYLVSKLGRITHERLQFLCPNCFKARLITDMERGETVCTECGSVLPADFDDPDSSLPFDVTFQPTSALSIQHSLGSPLTFRDQLKMQKENGDNHQTLKTFLETHSPDLVGKLKDGELVYDEKYAYLLDEETGTKVYMANLKDVATFVLNKNLLTTQDRSKLFHMNDMPLRVRRIRLITSAEHPELDKLLKEAYELSKFYNLDGNYTFNNNLGANIRRAFWLVHELKIKVPKLNLAETVFYATLNQGDKNHLAGQTVIAALKAQNNFDRTGFLYNLLVKFNAFLDETKKVSAIDEQNDENATELFELLAK